MYSPLVLNKFTVGQFSPPPPSCTLLVLPKGNSAPIPPHSLPSQPRAACRLLSVCVRLTALRRPLHAFWALAYSTQHSVLRVHPQCSVCQGCLPFLGLSDTSSRLCYSLSIHPSETPGVLPPLGLVAEVAVGLVVGIREPVSL